ncbi:MAG: Cro/CI family transcriptional regulator [Caulobacteraceae bacterium]|nr:Cro/CI family transcriptional regulator [Caulobacteraceae bacterium]
MRFSNLLSDEAVLAELGQRLQQARLDQRLTQAQLARAAGVSKRTLERLEDGEAGQLTNLIRCLRALGRLEDLERLIPEAPINPIDLLDYGRRAQRRRARFGAQPGLNEPPAKPWMWGDET